MHVDIIVFDYGGFFTKSIKSKNVVGVTPFLLAASSPKRTKEYLEVMYVSWFSFLPSDSIRQVVLVIANLSWTLRRCEVGIQGPHRLTSTFTVLVLLLLNVAVLWDFCLCSYFEFTLVYFIPQVIYFPSIILFRWCIVFLSELLCGMAFGSASSHFIVICLTENHVTKWLRIFCLHLISNSVP